MAFAKVNQDWDTQSGISTTLAYTATGLTLTAGNLVEGFVVWNETAASLTSVVDNKGNTYTLNTTVTGTAYRGAGFYLPNIAGGADPTFTITFSTGAGIRRFGFRQWSGAATTSVLAASAGQGQTTPATTTNAITSTAATPSQNDCLISGWCSGDLLDGTAGTGFTQDAAIGLSGDGGQTMLAEHLIQTTAASVAATLTDATGASNIITVMMAYKVAGGAPANYPLTLDGSSYGVTGADAGVQQSSPLTWLRVGR